MIQYSENGVVQGCYYGQNDRVDELNTRIQSRQFPENALRPNFDPRPVPTKYSIFPVIDRKVAPKESISPYLDNYGFSPVSANGPPKNYLQNIDQETILRNLTVGLQSANQGVFVPDSNSELFNNPVFSSTFSEQAFPHLFNKPVFETKNYIISNQDIGKRTFYNDTRTQLRNMAQVP